VADIGLLLLPVRKKTVKRFTQCHVFAQAPPGRRRNDKYPDTLHRPDLCKNVAMQ
jgi:hypothetical protein